MLSFSLLLFLYFCIFQLGEVLALPWLSPPADLPGLFSADAEALHDLGGWDHLRLLGLERQDRGRVGVCNQQALWDEEDAAQGGAKY